MCPFEVAHDHRTDESLLGMSGPSKIKVLKVHLKDSFKQRFSCSSDINRQKQGLIKIIF